MLNGTRSATAYFLILIFLAFALPGRVDAAEIITLQPFADQDQRYLYVEQLLEKSLAASGSQDTVVRAKERFSRDRLLQELIAGKSIHVIAEAPKPGWEDQLLTIRIPIRKGIQGYRLFLINRQDQPALSRVKTLEELKAFPTGSGAQWSTRRVLEENGFTVVTNPEYAALFKMLKLRRFVTFGRGINEAFREQEAFSSENENLVVEDTLCLFIPLPTYFFVSPAHPDLARRIETGLNKMIADGSFDRHFLDYHRDDIERARLSTRKIFSVTNPNLSAATPLDVPSYWFDPATASLVPPGDGS